jgi:hypothetical protein
MSRLITFGDSYTYGHGLADCHIPIKKVAFLTTEKNWAGPVPSKFAWPQVLGDMMGLEVVNKSAPGNSNIQILRDILSFENFLPSDLVIIGWTYPVRDCVFKKNFLGKDISFRISPWYDDKSFLKKWLAVHSDYDLAIRAGLYVHHAECFLKNKGIKQYHFSAHHGWVQVMPDFTITPENYIPYMILNRNLDLALDDSHPGPIAHKLAAEKLYEIINESK